MNTLGFKEIIDSFHEELLKTKEETVCVKIATDKWALKEIIGHLIDSAANNHQRFVRLQFDDLLAFPPYDGEEWVRIQKYINVNWSTLVGLWYSYNSLLLNIIENTDEAVYENVWIKGENAIPLKQLINEYFKHLELHIDHFKKRQEELLSI